MSFLLICEILGLFGNTLTADDKRYLYNMEYLPQLVQMQLYKKQQVFKIFCWISETYIRFKTFWEKKMSLIAYIF